jgi:hypothetical protein
MVSKKVKEEVKSTAETVKEEIKVNGSKLLDTVKKLIKEGNVRSIAIKDKNGKTMVKFPLTIGVVGAAFAPILAAVGAIAALVTDSSITVEREKKK